MAPRPFAPAMVPAAKKDAMYGVPSFPTPLSPEFKSRCMHVIHKTEVLKRIG